MLTLCGMCAHQSYAFVTHLYGFGICPEVLEVLELCSCYYGYSKFAKVKKWNRLDWVDLLSMQVNVLFALGMISLQTLG